MQGREAQAKLDEAMGKLGGAVESVKTKLLSEFAPAIADIVSSFVDFTQGVDGAEVALQQSIQNMVDKVVEKLPEFLEFGVQIIVAIAKGLIQNLPYLLEQLPELVGMIVSALGELGVELLKVGEELMGMLWSGIKGVWDDIAGWVSDKVSWLADKLMFWRSGSKEMSSETDGSHASGLPVVPYDGYRAVLHRGETVLNANNTSDLLAAIQKMASGGAGQAPITIPITLELDGQVLARKQYTYNQRESNLRGRSLVGVGG